MTETTDTRVVGQTLKASELRIGDIVTLKVGNDGDHFPFNHTVVRNIRVDDRYPKYGPQVYLSRPYAVLDDIITTGGIGVSFAAEEYSVAADSSNLTFVLVRPTNAEKHWRAVEAERKAKEAEVAQLRARLKDVSEAAAVADGARRAAEQKLTASQAYSVELEQKRQFLEQRLETEQKRVEGLRERIAAALDASLTAPELVETFLTAGGRS